MLLYILIGLVVVVIVFLGIVAAQPNDFRIERATLISAPAETVFGEVNDFHQWHD